MQLGFALTQHCNLRCAHCIRDDVTTVQSLSYALIDSLLDQASAHYGPLPVSLTGGEPLLHPEFGKLVDRFARGGHPYRFVSNGWHLARALPAIDRHRPTAVRLSLSGATRDVHDEERGRGSFDRVLMGVGLLTSLGVPTHLSLVIDRRTRHQLHATADLAEALGAHELHYILPQPVTESVRRASDLRLHEWDDVSAEISTIASVSRAHVRIARDFGFPDDAASECGTMNGTRLYVDAWGRLSMCCQLSDYGFTATDVVADLHVTPLGEAIAMHEQRVRALAVASAPRSRALAERLPCLRCARVTGKLEWLREHSESAWGSALCATAT